MATLIETCAEPPPADCPDWQLSVLDEVASTNTCASRLPAWSAVRAVTQTAGRGRVPNRHWVSDAGGMWLSAVVPCPDPREQWEVLPLAAGWAMLQALRELGVAYARLRWPNDVLVGRRKLAGLLVERFTRDTAVIGIGLNVRNRPEATTPALGGQTIRLEELTTRPPAIDDVTSMVLGWLRHAHALLAEGKFDTIADELNHAWGEPRRVEVTLHGSSSAFIGFFSGIDPRGRLRLRPATALTNEQVYDASEVALLRELD